MIKVLFLLSLTVISSLSLGQPPERPETRTGSFFFTGEMTVARERFTATALPDGRVLVAGGYGTFPDGSSAEFASAELYDPGTGQWTATGSMTQPRAGHRAVLLANGTVLVIGSWEQEDATAEVYDPATGSWERTGSLNASRPGSTATLLLNEKVLVAGGSQLTDVSRFRGVVRTAELYDPATGKWVTTGSMLIGRCDHSAVLLANGKVLVSGGNNLSDEGASLISSAELYNPATGTWERTGDMIAPRSGHTATLLRNKKVLIAGDLSGAHDYLPELYDPVAGTWSQTAPMVIHTSRLAIPLIGPGPCCDSATGLPNGNVLVASPIGLETYDFRSGQWSPVGLISQIRRGQAALLLANGNVLMVGGENGCFAFPCSYGSTTAIIYDPILRGNWSKTASLTMDSDSHTATLLTDGTVLVTGDQRGSEFFDETRADWTPVGALHAARTGHTTTLLQNGKVLAAGGFTLGSSVSPKSAELYDARNQQWSETGALIEPRANHTANLLPNGKVLIVGGVAANARTSLSTAELYNPASGQWTAAGAMNVARGYGHTATLLESGKILVVGGEELQTAELFDPESASWSLTSPMHSARTGHSAIRLPNGKVLVTGGTTDDSAAELFDPTTHSWSASGTMTALRSGHTATLLPDGKVLVMGGDEKGTAEFFDPEQQTWTSLGPVSAGNGTATLLQSGKLLLVEGRSAYLYETTSIFSPVLGLQLISGLPILHFKGLPGDRYRIEASDEVSGMAWREMTVIDLISNPFTFSDGHPSEGGTRFYRASKISHENSMATR